MNLQEIKALSDNELHIKVAELLGWIKFWQPADDEGTGHWEWHKGSQNVRQLPNYPQDLNACAEMETALFGHDDSGHLVGCYLAKLRVTANTHVSEWRLPFATARQRCEAFVACLTERT